MKRGSSVVMAEKSAVELSKGVTMPKVWSLERSLIVGLVNSTFGMRKMTSRDSIPSTNAWKPSAVSPASKVSS